MGRLFKILDDNAYSFEMSDEVKEGKIKLVDKFYDLVDEYIGDEEIEGIDIKVGEINVVKISVDVDNVYIEDENGNVFNFFEDITLKEIKSLLSSVRKIIKEYFE